ncbi:MAG: tetratricopeptide repeat protein [Oculatellaceae cyanobacterium Prado106]|nr:tetratricopeptide repeat protein [Oculatellaceae cyanobacterium Prado106]
MDISSFQSQRKRTGSVNCPSGTASTRSQSHTGAAAKRWQPKSAKLNNPTPHPAELALRQTEPDTLLRQKALAKAQMGFYTEAIVLFNQLIKRNPINANDFSNRGLVYFQSGQADAAILDYNRALDLNPRLDSAYNNRANYYAAQGRFLEAILDYDIALDLNPMNVRAWINQGITFRDLEMYDRAVESFEAALHLGRLEGHIYAERGRAYHLRGDWNCAIADYQKAIAELPELPASERLRLQVEGWLSELLEPLF